MTTRTANTALDHALPGGTSFELVAIGGLIGVALSIAAHFSAGVHTVQAIVGAGLAFLVGHIFGRIGARTLSEAALRGATVGAAASTFAFAAGAVLGDQALIGLAGCAIGGLAGVLGALLARGTHGF